jgi:hypothetical protein
MQSHSYQASLPTRSINFSGNQQYSSSSAIKYKSPSDPTYTKAESAIGGHHCNGKIDKEYEEDQDMTQRDEYQDHYSGKSVKSRCNLIIPW